MEAKKPKITIFTVLGIVVILMFACDTPKSCGKSREELNQDMVATTFYGYSTQTALALSKLVYPIRFEGMGTATRDCAMSAKVVFSVTSVTDCSVNIELPGACSGPLAETYGISLSFQGSVTERDKEPSSCDISACNTGDASGTVLFTGSEMIGTSELSCPGSQLVLEFNPLPKINP